MHTSSVVAHASPSSKTSHLLSSPLSEARRVQCALQLRAAPACSPQSQATASVNPLRGKPSGTNFLMDDERTQPVSAEVLSSNVSKTETAMSPMIQDQKEDAPPGTVSPGVGWGGPQLRRTKPGWQLMPANSVLRKLRQEDSQEFKASLGYRVGAFFSDNKIQNCHFQSAPPLFRAQ